MADGLVSTPGCQERELLAQAEHPEIRHDHSLRREHRAEDHAAIAGCDQVAGKESLEATQRARARDPEHRRVLAYDDRTEDHAAIAGCNQVAGKESLEA